jgi:hypothetical protein
MLKDIDMVGDDLGFWIGTCKKDGQDVPVADAQPTLKIPDIVIGGSRVRSSENLFNRWKLKLHHLIPKLKSNPISKESMLQTGF